jgi:GNAT superfamily N-acetyltransferase
MPDTLEFRAMTRADIDEAAALVADSFVGYRAFAPASWRPPGESEQVRGLQRWIEDPGFWGELACESGELAGHATFIPAMRHTFLAAQDPTLAHLGHLFVKPRYWGSGVATHLLAHATDAAAKRGFATMRLFVPVGQARARRFYAREGFTAMGEPFEFGLGLPVLEHRRQLAP